MTRTPYLHSVALAALLLSSFPAASDGGAVKASCTQNGRVVYREDLPPGTSSDRRLEIAAANRNALCVFIRADAPAQAPRLTDDPAIAAAGGVEGEGLAAALSFLSSGESVGSPYDPAVKAAMEDFLRAENAFTSDGTSVNLTIGIYSGASGEDVLGHWKYIVENSRVLGRMTPTVETVGDVTVLSLRDVADADAATVCEEAELFASGCLAVF